MLALALALAPAAAAAAAPPAHFVFLLSDDTCGPLFSTLRWKSLKRVSIDGPYAPSCGISFSEARWIGPQPGDSEPGTIYPCEASSGDSVEFEEPIVTCV